jgi:hypothetical protein
MQIKNLKPEIAVIILLWISITASVIFNPDFSIQFLLAMVGTMAATVALKYQSKLATAILTFVLGLSTIGLIVPSTVFEIAFGPVKLIPLFLFLLLLSMRYHVLKGMLMDRDAHIESLPRSNIAFFKKQFESLSFKEIQSRLDNENIVPDAKTALMELLEEKRTR